MEKTIANITININYDTLSIKNEKNAKKWRS